ncbi:MAG: cupin domain-containing protein, partial [bacterium]
MRIWKFASAVLMAVALSAGVASDVRAAELDSHVAVTAAEVQWKDSTNPLLPNVQLSVLDGDPTKEGPFVMRIKVPAKYKIPPHWHPADERVTVISGEFNVGTGDIFDMNAAKMLPAGSFMHMPTGVHHFAFTRVEAVIQLNGIGPWKLVPVN